MANVGPALTDSLDETMTVLRSLVSRGDPSGEPVHTETHRERGQTGRGGLLAIIANAHLENPRIAMTRHDMTILSWMRM
jgi:hypothetical protein